MSITNNDSVDVNDKTKALSKEKKKVIIVGGGIGGLAVAARIAAAFKTNNEQQQQCDVTIIEKNNVLGGRCGSFSVSVDKGIFRHERGPSLLLLPSIYHDIFIDCTSSSSPNQVGSNSSPKTVAEEYGLSMKQCRPAYQVVFEDGDKIDVGFPENTLDIDDDDEDMQLAKKKSQDTMNHLEPDGLKKWNDYMRICSAYLDCGLPNFIEERIELSSFPAFIREAVSDFGKAWPLKPHSDVLDAIFTSNKMKALASFQDLYVGLEPYRNSQLVGGGVLQTTAPAVFGLLAAIELHPTNKKCGVFAPVGGFVAVTDALENLNKDLGITVQYGKTVSKITDDGVYVCDTTTNMADGSSSISDNKESKNHFLPADLIIVNADLPYATKSLLVKELASNSNNKSNSDYPTDKAAFTPKFDWDDSFSFSSGVISFHWSVDIVLDELNTHNVFLVAASQSQAKNSWQVLRSNSGDINKPNDPFNFYVHRPSKTDPSAAPNGCDSIMILVPCRTLLRDEDCANLPRDQAIGLYKKQFSNDVIGNTREAVLERLGVLSSLRNLKDHIVHEVVDTPATYADQFNVAAGTPFALSHGFGQLSLTRPGAESSDTPSILFCGASSRPGNGVPLVLIGAKQVAEKAIRKLKEK